MKKIYVGMGAGFGGDRSDAAQAVIQELNKQSGAKFLIYETLAERTLAQAQLNYKKNPTEGYAPSLERLLKPAIKACIESGITIIGNFGAASPKNAALRIQAIAKEQGLKPLKIATIEGDNLLHILDTDYFKTHETEGDLLQQQQNLIAANAYLGAFQIAQAIDQGAQIVITGRVADPSLIVGAAIHAFQLQEDDLDLLAAATLTGHLLECGAQITGGYFADPGVKDVQGLSTLGYPIAEISADGTAIISKPASTGGVVNLMTVKEQLLYEIHDPANYLTPDVTLDLSSVKLEQLEPDKVRVSGAKGKPRPETLKATICVDGGYLAEGEISYAGPNATARANLAGELIQERLQQRWGSATAPFRIDIIGLVSVLGSNANNKTFLNDSLPNNEDVRLRVAIASEEHAQAQFLVDEVEALYCTGPAGGAGVRTRISPRLFSTSCAIERKYIHPSVTLISE